MNILVFNSKSAGAAALGIGLLLLLAPVSISAQSGNFQRYRVVDLGPVGPPPGQPFYVTNNGFVALTAVTSENKSHSYLWFDGWKAPLDAPGYKGNSAAFGVNDWGDAVGEAESGKVDPMKEDFCGFHALGMNTDGDSCLPVIWKNGTMKVLPTLGGNNGSVNMINSRGEAAGQAETSAPDHNCPAPQKLSFEAVVWSGGRVHALPTIDGDINGVALAVNLKGQAVGSSGDCAVFNVANFLPIQPVHALLWVNGKAKDLGNLGGDGHSGAGNLALNVNNRGEVVGTSNLPGNFPFHAFLWTREKGMRDLETLAGDIASVAVAISDEGEIVGISLDQNFNARAFMWRAGIMKDLNTLVPKSTSLLLITACSISTRGEIAGLAANKVTGEFHGYVLKPIY
jgi:probable HAF family extracellular repeat protein